MANKRCKRCIMPAEYPGITFDSGGVCNHCVQSNADIGKNKADQLGRDELIELVRSAGRNGQYDCVIPLSGGKDSTYVLYHAVKELGLEAKRSSCASMDLDNRRRGSYKHTGR